MNGELSDSFNENVKCPRFSYNPETVSLLEEREDSTVNAPNIITSSLFALVIELGISGMLTQLSWSFDLPIYQIFHTLQAITCFVINGVASNVPDRRLFELASLFVFFALCTCINAISARGLYSVFSPYDSALLYYGITMTLISLCLLSTGQALTFVAFYCYLLKCVPLAQCYGKYLSIFIVIVQFGEIADEWIYATDNITVSVCVLYCFICLSCLFYFFALRIIKIPAFDQIDVQPEHFGGRGRARDDVLYFVRDMIKTQTWNPEETEESRPQARAPPAPQKAKNSYFLNFIDKSPELKSYIRIFFGSLTGLNFVLQSFVTVYVTELTLQFRQIAFLSEAQVQEISTNFAIPEAAFYRLFVLIFELLMIPIVFALGYYFDYLSQRFGSKLRARFIIQVDAFAVTLLGLCAYSSVSFNTIWARVTIITLAIVASGLQYTSLFVYLAAEFPRAKRIAVCVVSGVYNLMQMIFGIYDVAMAVSSAYMQLIVLLVNAVNIGITAGLLARGRAVQSE